MSTLLFGAAHRVIATAVLLGIVAAGCCSACGGTDAPQPPVPHPAVVAYVQQLCAVNTELTGLPVPLRIPRGAPESVRPVVLQYLQQALITVQQARAKLDVLGTGPARGEAVRDAYRRALVKMEKELVNYQGLARVIPPGDLDAPAGLAAVEMVTFVPDGPGLDDLRADPETGPATRTADGCGG